MKKGLDNQENYESTFTLNKEDAALIVRSDMSTDLVIPDRNPNDEAGSAAFLVMCFACALKDGMIMDLILKNAESLLAEVREEDASL